MQHDLSVKGENVQAIYGLYKSGRLYVNRRYQRKLVWDIDEKRAFIDSLLKGFPVPLVLLAETKINGKDAYEIIDGMQRLNALIGFLENEFSLSKNSKNGGFFDLNTMVETKESLDNERLVQNLPILERDQCYNLARYTLPISFYSFDNEDQIDEVFRRINSSGKRLSKQDLRSAGALGVFPTLVRQLAAKIRGDDSPSDILPLSQMSTISISNKGLDYRLNVDNIFWVKQHILDKKDIRASRDEEIIANSLIYMTFKEAKPASSEQLDKYFSDEQKASDLEVILQTQLTPEVLANEYVQTHDVICNILQELGGSLTFNDCIPSANGQHVPRYYEIVFNAFYKLLFIKGLEVFDLVGIKEVMLNIGNKINVTTGGSWSAAKRQQDIDAVVGLLRDYFKERKSNDPISQWTTELISLLNQSVVEQTLYDFKQGFHRLHNNCELDTNLFGKVVKTLTAMANLGPKTSGYICIGITDSEDDAILVKKLHGVGFYKVANHNDFHITGIDHEILMSGKTADLWFKSIKDMINKEPVSDNFKANLARNIRLVRYKDKTVLVLIVKNLGEPAYYNNKYYQRQGNDVNEISPSNYPNFFMNFSNS